MKLIPEIKTYLESYQGLSKERLKQSLMLIDQYLPNTTQTFAYQMPTFKRKKNLIHVACYRDHLGVYPGPKGVTYLKSILPNAITSKGTWRIPHQSPFLEKAFIQLCQWIDQHG